MKKIDISDKKDTNSDISDKKDTKSGIFGKKDKSIGISNESNINAEMADKSNINAELSEKDKIIKKEITKYKKIFNVLDSDKKIFAEKLYTQAAFMSATLSELAETVKREGAVATYTNGNGFETTSEHPAQKSYNTMIKNYNSVIKALIDLLPGESGEADELMEFLNKRS